MRRFIARLTAGLIVATGMCVVFIHPALAADKPDQPATLAKGFRALFDGESFEGWEVRSGVATYKVEDGAIVGTTVAGSPNTFLCTKERFGDFELRFEVKVDPALNSGVQIRSNAYDEETTVEMERDGKKIKRTWPADRVHGYQVEISNEERGTSGGIYDEARRGWLDDISSDPKASKAFQDNEWNAFRVVCRGDRIRTWVNGVPCANLQDDMTAEGFIGLQVHGYSGETPAQVRWRNIQIRTFGGKKQGDAPRQKAKTNDLATAAGSPNVLLVMVDDMGWSDLGCYGGEIRTPNIDALAAAGLRFTQFYNTAKCAQTRATLLSGQYHDEVGIEALRNCWTLGEAMREAGYFTAMTGKWHLKAQPTDRGFDRYFGHLSGATDFFAGDNTFRLNGQPFEVPKQGFYTTDANVDYATQFIDESRATGQPFFCYIAFNAPHYPLQAPREDVERYRGKYDQGWDVVRQQRYARQKKMGLISEDQELTPRADDVPAWASLTEEQQREQAFRMEVYAAMVDRVDQNVGRLIDHLDEQNILENTIVMLISDNGACPFDRNHHIDGMPWEAGTHYTYDKGWAHACNTPWREYKQNQHEGGISSPCVVHWPAGLKVQRGSMTAEVSHLVDVMATLVDLTDVQYPAQYGGQPLQPLRGRSLLPILAGETPAPRGELYFDFAGKNHALRDGRWKLVSKDRGPWELYDIEADRGELNNLVDSQSERAAGMQASWEAWAREAGVSKGQPGQRKAKQRGAGAD